MKVLICDDEPLARERIERLVKRTEGYQVIGQAGNGIEALEKTRLLEPDILILDIQMPVMNGLEAAQHIATLPQAPAILFCTAFDQYAIEAFQVNAIAYLLKPVRQEDLIKALQSSSKLNKAQMADLQQTLEAPLQHPFQNRTHISARTHRGIELIPIEDIHFFKADQKYVVIRHIRGEVLVDQPLKDFEKELAGRFVRIHRNALACVHYIEGLEMTGAGHYQVRFKSIEEKLPVSRRHAAQLRKLLKSL